MSTELETPPAPETPIVDNGAGTQQPPAAPDFRQAFFAQAQEKLGREFKDETDLLSYYGAIQGERDQYKARAESSVNLSPALAEVQKWLESEKFEGSDEEVMQRAVEYFRRNSTDYAKMASENPEALLREQYAAQNSAYSREDIDALVSRKVRTYQNEAREAGLEEEKDIADYVRREMSLEAKGFVPALNARKQQLRFKPESIPQPRSQEEMDADNLAKSRAWAQSTYDAARSFKGLSLGEAGEWEVKLLDDQGNPREEYLPMLKSIASNEWISRFFNNDGTPNHGEMLRYEAQMQFAAQAVSRRAADAHGQGAADTVRTLRNPNAGDNNPPPPPSNGKMTMEEYVKRPVHHFR
jgi:hypothetical protein